MKKKAQAAMEFLMTYGWAILVVLVVIGALAYFGVLSPKKLLPDKCLFGPGIGTCTDYQATETNGALSLVLTNGFGEQITPTTVTFGATSSCSDASTLAAVAPGEQFDIDITGCNFVEGDKTNEEVTITYTKGTGTLPHQVSGQVSIAIQP